MTTEHLFEWRRDHDFVVSTDPTRLDLDVIHDFLTHSYWVPGIPRDVVARAIEHSFCFGLYICTSSTETQIGFGRLITDFSSLAYLADVFVLPAYRGRGLGTWLVQCIIECPALQGLRTMSLATADAHELYRRFGFDSLANPEAQMTRKQQMDWHRPDQVRE